jgi:hypothetical protein
MALAKVLASATELQAETANLAAERGQHQSPAMAMYLEG